MTPMTHVVTCHCSARDVSADTVPVQRDGMHPRAVAL